MNLKKGQIVETECQCCGAKNRYKLIRTDKNVEYSDGKFTTFRFKGLKGNCNLIDQSCIVSIKDCKEGWVNYLQIIK